MILFAVSFTFGTWLLQQQAALPDFSWAWLLLAYPLTLFPSLLRTKAPFVRAAGTLLLAVSACGAGFFHAAWQADRRLAVSLPDEWQGRDIEVIGVVAELPRRHERGQRFVFDVEQTVTPDARVPPRVYLSTYPEKAEHIEFRAGERWHLTLRMKQPHGTANPYGFDFEAWALERNIRAVGYVHNKGDNRRIDTLAQTTLFRSLGYRIETWREAVRDKISTSLGDAPYSGVLTALAIGDQGSIAHAQWQLFTRTGVNHLMSISGLHITMLSSLGFIAAYWLWRRSTRLILLLPARKAAALAAVLTGIAYALLSGFAVPAQRTVYMVGSVAAALSLNRNFSPGQILAIALLGVLIPDPWAVIAAGFWLSFGAVALIFFVTAHRIGTRDQLPQGGSMTKAVAGAGRALSEYGKVQWAMTIGLTPLLLGLFQQASLVSPIANAVAIPMVSLAVVPLTLLGAALPFDSSLWLAHLVMDGAVRFLEMLNTLPQAVWAQHAPPAWSIAAAVLGAMMILLPRGFPARWLGFVLMLPMFLNKPEPPAEGTLRVIIFDVGQGLAVALQTRSHALLYDAGPDFSGEADSGNRILAPGLRALGINRLDGLILSHDDTDHTGGAGSLMQTIPVGWVSSSQPIDSLKTVWAEPVETHLPIGKSNVLIAEPNKGGRANGIQTTIAAIESRRCQDGESWTWDGVQFEMLHPAPGHANSAKTHDNDRSCVLRVGIGEQSILLAGDIEKNSEMRLMREHGRKLHASLVIAPHHGSKSSSSDEFVAAVDPSYVAFTAGYRNRFGHPREEVMQRYAGRGAQLLRSDQDGAIMVEMNAQGLQVEPYRRMNRRYWTHFLPH